MSMPRRDAATLVEVLVAIFVMGIGLLAVLALFPLGVLRMAQAIQDNCTGNIAQSADALGTLKNIRNDAQIAVPSDGFTNPGAGLAALTDPNGPSYPVFVDPIGYRTAAGTPSQTWLGGTLGVPRRSASFVETAANPTSAAL